MSVITQLVEMTCELARPELDLAILGEGNTSALLDGDRYYVKASGTMMRAIDAHGFVLLDRAAAAGLLDTALADDAAIQQALLGTRLEGDRQPSVEAMMHAYLLGLPGVNFVGHTHPVSVNSILCSVQAEALTQVCLFPDQIVCCGPSPVYVPYTDPGLPLARLVRERVMAWMDANGMTPRAILLQNHGLFALGNTPKEVLSCSMMWAKTARVILGAMACGGVNALRQAHIDRIVTRPDEKYRQQVIAGK